MEIVDNLNTADLILTKIRYFTKYCISYSFPIRKGKGPDKYGVPKAKKSHIFMVKLYFNCYANINIVSVQF